MEIYKQKKLFIIRSFVWKGLKRPSCC